MLLHAAPLDGVREGHRVAEAVDEPVRDDLVEAPRLCEEREQRRLAPCDDGREAVEPLDEGLAAVEHADVVEGGVPPRASMPRTMASVRSKSSSDDQASP